MTPISAAPPRAGDPTAEAQPIGWRRLAGAPAAVAVLLCLAGAVGETLGTVVAGRLAEGATVGLVAALAACVVLGAVLESVGRVIWAGVSDRAEGRLRDDLVAAAWAQPVHRLSEQAAGEILDRVDDDTHEVGTLVRRQVWESLRTIFVTLPMWVVAGLTWWPAWILFPVAAAACLLVVRPLLGTIAERKVTEEIAWTDHAAIFEEGVAARDDLRTSLGAAFILRRSTEQAARVLRLFRRVVAAQVALIFRSTALLNGLLGAVVVIGAALVLGGRLGLGELVTLVLLTTIFVGQIGRLAEQLPELQAGIGAVIRLRQLLEAEREPTGGLPLPDGPLELRIDGLDFGYADGGFRLRVDDLTLPAGQTLALVGRSGSGKSTLAALLSRAVEPPPGTITLAGTGIDRLRLTDLRRAVGVITQRTEILAGTLAENITLFTDISRERVAAAIDELGLTAWVDSLPGGLDTPLGPGGATLSAGEEQLVSFARLLVREVRVVVLDEATARMDPRTERLVIAASARLLHGRTGIVIAHRLATTRRADRVAVLAAGTVLQQGPRAELERAPGPYRDLLSDAGEWLEGGPAGEPEPAAADPAGVGTLRRRTDAPDRPDPGAIPSLVRVVTRAITAHPQWGMLGAVLFGIAALIGGYGTVTAYLWGQIVAALSAPTVDPARLWPLVAGMIGSLFAWVVLFPLAIRQYLPWWGEILLRVRSSVLIAQTAQRRLPRDPPGEVVSRALDADRLSRYADRWVDFVNGLVVVVVTTVLARNLAAGAVLVVVMVAAALASSLGRPVAGRSAASAATARAGFGRALVSALDATRTVKLADATGAVHAHLRRVDAGRVAAAVREHRVQAALDGVPMVIVQGGVVAVWAIHLLGGWDLATALMLSVTVVGFDYFGMVTGWVITEAPGTRAWQRETSRLAGGSDLIRLPPNVDLVRGTAPAPGEPAALAPLRRLELSDVSVVHEDGTIGVEDVSLSIAPGELVLLLGPIGAGKSSVLRALAGLVDHTGTITWNGDPVTDVELYLRPSQVAYVAQLPRVLSGSYADNIVLDHAGRNAAQAADAARLGPDLAAAGGLDTVVGHRGVRLSGGQVQRLALARALATRAELVLADDISSALDATTEIELWRTLRGRGTTVIGSTSKRSALAVADRVLVLDQGRVVAAGTWPELAGRYGHLAG